MTLAVKHKAALMKEASSMQVKFSEDLRNATQMERTVNQIGDLPTEFASILQSQSGQVEEVNDDAKQTEEHVQSSKLQLQLTIERSEKNQKSIVFICWPRAATATPRLDREVRNDHMFACVFNV